MIRRLLVGCARILFQSALVCFVLGGLLAYAAYRLIRAGFARDHGMPVRDALFQLALAAETLRRALADRPGPARVVPVETSDETEEPPPPG